MYVVYFNEWMYVYMIVCMYVCMYDCMLWMYNCMLCMYAMWCYPEWVLPGKRRPPGGSPRCPGPCSSGPGRSRQVDLTRASETAGRGCRRPFLSIIVRILKIYVCLCLCMCLCMYVCICMYKCMYVFVCMYVYINCINVCMYVCIFCMNIIFLLIYTCIL